MEKLLGPYKKKLLKLQVKDPGVGLWNPWSNEGNHVKSREIGLCVEIHNFQRIVIKISCTGQEAATNNKRSFYSYTPCRV